MGTLCIEASVRKVGAVATSVDRAEELWATWVRKLLRKLLPNASFAEVKPVTTAS